MMDAAQYREIVDALTALRNYRNAHQAYMDQATARGELVWGNNPYQVQLEMAIETVKNNAVDWLSSLIVENLVLRTELQELKGGGDANS